MNDIERLKMMDLEDQLKFCRNQNKELKDDVKRLKMLLNGENTIENSLSKTTSPFDKLKSSYRNKDKHK